MDGRLDGNLLEFLLNILATRVFPFKVFQILSAGIKRLIELWLSAKIFSTKISLDVLLFS